MNEIKFIDYIFYVSSKFFQMYSVSETYSSTVIRRKNPLSKNSTIIFRMVEIASLNLKITMKLADACYRLNLSKKSVKSNLSTILSITTGRPAPFPALASLLLCEATLIRITFYRAYITSVRKNISVQRMGIQMPTSSIL